MEPVLTVKTEEKDYRIYPFIFTQPLIGTFFQKASRHPNLFNHEVRTDFNKFLGLFVQEDSAHRVTPRGLLWYIDEDFKGVFYLTDIDGSINATAHFTFFRRIPSVEKLTKSMIQWVFEKYEFNRLSAELPMYVAKKWYELIEGLGFRYEGKRRRALQFNNRLFDIKLYGMLKEEAFDPTFKYSPKAQLVTSEAK